MDANINFTALFVGIIIAVYVVVRFRETKLERKAWAYPSLIATFPVYYWVFALYGSDLQVFYKEIWVGTIFVSLIFVSLKIKRSMGLLLLAVTCISHAVYDVVHDELFTNSGVPSWWPEFCGSIDVLIGFYLVYLSRLRLFVLSG